MQACNDAATALLRKNSIGFDMASVKPRRFANVPELQDKLKAEQRVRKQQSKRLQVCELEIKSLQLQVESCDSVMFAR